MGPGGAGARALGAAAEALEGFLGPAGAAKLVLEAPRGRAGGGGGRGEAFCEAAEFLLALEPEGPGAAAVVALQVLVEEGGRWAQCGCAGLAALAARLALRAGGLSERGVPPRALNSGLQRAQAECEAALAAAARPAWAEAGVPEGPDGGQGGADDVAWFFEPSPAEGPGAPPQPAPPAASPERPGAGEGHAFRDLAWGLLPRFPGLRERLAPGALGALRPPPRSGPRPEVATSAVVGPCAPGGFCSAIFPGVVLRDSPAFLAPVAPWARGRFDEAAGAAPTEGAGGTFAVFVVAAAGPALREQAGGEPAEAALARVLAAAAGLPVLVVAGFLVPTSLAFRLEAAGVSWVGGVSVAGLRRCTALAACQLAADWASLASARPHLGAARAEVLEGGWDPDDPGAQGLRVRQAVVLRPLATPRGGAEVAAMPVAAVACHPVRWVAEQAARQLERFLPALWEAWDGGGGSVVPGGGAAELLCARRLREAGSRVLARAADAAGKPGERELDPLVFAMVADALCDVADRTLAAFDVPLEERLAQLQLQAGGGLGSGGGGGGASSTSLLESGRELLGVESLGGKARALRAAFDVAHIVLDARATLTNAAPVQSIDSVKT